MAITYPKLGEILKKLLFDRDMNPTDLARALNISQPTIHRLVTGSSKRPYKSSLESIAQYFSISVDQLLGNSSLDKNNDLQKSSLIRNIPVLNWLEITTKKPEDCNSDEHIIVSQEISNTAFALISSDSSMEPLFPQDTLLIFDRKVIPQDRGYVLAQLFDTKIVVFRQLLVDLDHRYLKPLNPDLNQQKMYLLDKKDHILAVLIESRFNHRVNKKIE